MPYYLSYLEINGHAAMMLSEQQHTDGPCRIICDVGFGFAPNIARDGVGYFTAHKGHVREETNASRALYSSSAEVMHRTFELSEAEVTKFFEVLNRDRQIKAAPIEQGKDSVTVVGGPDYQQIKNNCKTYAMGVLKEIGIVDAENLSNYFIQRTRTTDHLLKNITNQDIFCPLKEQLIEKITTSLTDLNTQINALLEKADEIDNPEKREKFISDIQEVLKLSTSLLEQRSKIGIMQSLNKRFGQISSLLDAISTHKEIPGKNKFKEDLVAIEGMAKKVSELSNKGQLEFYWKTTPLLAKRVHLDNFNDQEKAFYLTKIKGNEISDGLTLMLTEINRQLGLQNIHSDLRSDLKQLKALVEKEKTTLDQNNQIFLNAISRCQQEDNSEEILTVCRKQQITLDQSVDLLEKRIDGFTPRSSETSFLMRFLDRIISYLKKDFVTIEKTTSQVLEGVEKIKESVTKNGLMFFASHSDNPHQQEQEKDEPTP